MVGSFEILKFLCPLFPLDIEKTYSNETNISPMSHPHVVITSYGLVKSSRMDFLGGRKDDSLYWDYIVTDEGHTLKNSNTEQHKAVARVARSSRTHRLLLTGEF